MNVARCDGCRWWARDTHAVGDCGKRTGDDAVRLASDRCHLHTPLVVFSQPADPHVVIPDSEGGTRVSLGLWPAFKHFVREMRGHR